MSMMRILGRSRAYTPQAQALFARMSNQPTAARARLIDTVIRILIAQGVWSTLDGLWFTAAADAQAASLNWVSSSGNLTAVNSPAFTVDRGYTCDGATAWLNTNLTSGSGNAAQNSHAAGVYMNVDPNFGGFQFSNGVLEIGARALAGPAFEVLSAGGGGQTVTVADGTGYSGFTRTASTAFTMQKNRAQTPKSATTSGFAAAPYKLMQNGGTGFSTGQIAAAHIGGGLTTDQLTVVQQQILYYLTGVGGA